MADNVFGSLSSDDLDAIASLYDQQEEQAAPTPPPENQSTGFFGDMGRMVGVGLNSLMDTGGALTSAVGLDQAGDFLREKAQSRTQELYSQLTPEQKAANELSYIKKNDDGSYSLGEGATSFRKIAGTVAESAPSMAAAIAPEALITRSLIVRGLSKKAAELAAGEVAKLSAKEMAAYGITGAAIGEGSVGGAMAYTNVYDSVKNIPDETLRQSEQFKKFYDKTDGETDEGQRFSVAKEKFATWQAMKAAGLTTLATAVFGAPSGAGLAKIIGGEEGRNFLTTIMKQAFSEGVAQEFPQSMAETYIAGEEIGAGDPSKKATTLNMLESGVGGLVAGTVMGAGSAVFASVAKAKPKNMLEENKEEDDQAQPDPEKVKAADKVSQQLREWEKARDSGDLTEEEYDSLKSNLLNVDATGSLDDLAKTEEETKAEQPAPLQTDPAVQGPALEHNPTENVPALSRNTPPDAIPRTPPEVIESGTRLGLANNMINPADETQAGVEPKAEIPQPKTFTEQLSERPEIQAITEKRDQARPDFQKIETFFKEQIAQGKSYNQAKKALSSLADKLGFKTKSGRLDHPKIQKALTAFGFKNGEDLYKTLKADAPQETQEVQEQQKPQETQEIPVASGIKDDEIVDSAASQEVVSEEKSVKKTKEVVNQPVTQSEKGGKENQIGVYDAKDNLVETHPNNFTRKAVNAIASKVDGVVENFNRKLKVAKIKKADGETLFVKEEPKTDTTNKETKPEPQKTEPAKKSPKPEPLDDVVVKTKVLSKTGKTFRHNVEVKAKTALDGIDSTIKMLADVMRCIGS